MKESLTSNPDISRESIEKALPDIKALLLTSYQEQGNNLYTLDQSFEKVKKLCQDIALLLKGKGITIEPTQSAIIAFFRKSNIVFPISPMAVGPGKYRVNHPLYLLGKSELYDMSRIRFDASYGLPIQKKAISTFDVKETLIPDIRESRGFMLDGLTVGNSQNGESTILLFSDRIVQNAKKEGLGIREYKDIVVTNEVSQTYFAELISPQFYNVRLSEDLKIPAPPNTTIYQLNEAFSDLCSFKFTKGGKEEMMRILQSNEDGYKLSKLILGANLKLRFPMLQESMIPDKIKSMSPEEFSKTKEFVIEGYEKNLLPIIGAIYKVAKTKRIHKESKYST